MWEKAHDPAFIANASLDDTKAAHAAAGLPTACAPIRFTPNPVKSGGQLTLIDAGTGGQTGRPKAGMFIKHLAAAGVDPGAANHILVSHLHPDHIFGLMTKAPANKVVFPNAVLQLPATEYEDWMDPGNIDKTAEARRPLARRVEATRRRLLDRVVAGSTVVTGYHFPFPAAGKIVKDGDSYAFVPA